MFRSVGGIGCWIRCRAGVLDHLMGCGFLLLLDIGVGSILPVGTAEEVDVVLGRWLGIARPV